MTINKLFGYHIKGQFFSLWAEAQEERTLFGDYLAFAALIVLFDVFISSIYTNSTI